MGSIFSLYLSIHYLFVFSLLPLLVCFVLFCLVCLIFNGKQHENWTCLYFLRYCSASYSTSSLWTQIQSITLALKASWVKAEKMKETGESNLTMETKTFFFSCIRL